MIQTIWIDQSEEMTCPANKLAIFAHNEDFSYGKPPQIVKDINSCQSKDTILAMQQ